MEAGEVEVGAGHEEILLGCLLEGECDHPDDAFVCWFSVCVLDRRWSFFMRCILVL
jgi:hypothetical protein